MRCQKTQTKPDSHLRATETDCDSSTAHPSSKPQADNLGAGQKLSSARQADQTAGSEGGIAPGVAGENQTVLEICGEGAAALELHDKGGAAPEPIGSRNESVLGVGCLFGAVTPK